MVTLSFELTLVVVILNVAVVFPGGIATDVGTEAALLPLATLIVNPPAGAGTFKVIVPVLDFPPATFSGLNFKLRIAGAVRVRDASFVIPFKVAEIWTDVVVATTFDFITNDTVDLPPGTVTVAGTIAEALLDSS